MADEKTAALERQVAELSAKVELLGVQVEAILRAGLTPEELAAEEDAGIAKLKRQVAELGADLAISVDDVVRAWVAGEWCQDTGNPLIVVNHCVSEEPGMVTLAAHLEQALPDIKVTHIPQKCTFKSVGTSVGT